MKFLNSFIHLVYPNICVGCSGHLGHQEKFICSFCEHQLPLFETRYNPDNQVNKLFWGRSKVAFGSALLRYSHTNMVQKLLHEFKYYGNKELGCFLGQKMALSFKNTFHSKNIHAIIPLPLHPKKQMIRGFNQSEILANELGALHHIPVFNDAIVRRVHNSTQTKKSRFDRHLNVKSIFKLVKQSKLEFKHVLVIDDVITTGATIEALASELEQVEGIKVSVLALAVAI